MSELPPRAEIVDALRTAVAPAVVATVAVVGGIAALSWMIARKRPSPDWRRVIPSVAPLALAAGMAAGNYSRVAFPWAPDGKWWHIGLWAIGLAFLVECAAQLPGVAVGVGQLIRGTAAGVIASFVVPADWRGQAPWSVLVVAAGMAVQWAVVDAVGRRSPGGAVAAAVAIAAGGAAAVSLHAGSAGFMDVATFVFCGLAVIAAFAWLTRVDGSPAAAVATVPLVVVLLLGRVLRDSDVPDSSFVLVGVAPVVLGVFLLPGPRRYNGTRVGGLLKVLAVTLPVTVAVYRAMEAAPYTFGTKDEAW